MSVGNSLLAAFWCSIRIVRITRKEKIIAVEARSSESTHEVIETNKKPRVGSLPKFPLLRAKKKIDPVETS